MATPLFAAVVGWKDGEEEGFAVVGGAVVVDFEEDVVVVEVIVVSAVDVSLEEDVDVDVAAAVLSSPVDEGAGPFPSTLFGHR